MTTAFTSRSRITPIALAILLITGCGESSKETYPTQAGPTFGPNEGLVSPLPGGAYIEVVDEPIGVESRLVVYFYASVAMDAPLIPTPSDVSIELLMPGGESTTVPLSPGGGDSRFSSSPGDYIFDPLIGTLNATVGGETVAAPFTGRQS